MYQGFSIVLLNLFLYVLGSACACAGPLHEAIQAGDLAKVREAIERGADPNENDFVLGSPLHMAAYAGHTDIVE